MEKIGLHEIREKFLEFFSSKDHLRQPSYSLIPQNDKSLLLIGAGMAPLKKYFTKEAVPPYPRMTTSQKCVRTGDIDNVGKTLRHLTFFEMLGNFSFGDYFKKEAIAWAWEFLTEVMHLPEEKLWVSIYLDDDEAHDLWRDMIGVPEEKIVRLGKEDNFWELEVGPSGPCTEIHYDKGEAFGCGRPDCKPGCDCDRFMEVWNLVFTQFDKDTQGVYHPLANPNIDTGMGLERIACVMENVESVYDIGAIHEIIDVVTEICGKGYGVNHDDDVYLRIIADHSRAMTFLVNDGVVPSNEGRGYVLRKLIRRAARQGMLLGIDHAFLEQPVRKVIDSWSVAYPELKENEHVILEVINTEEGRFKRTIVQGTDLLNEKMNELKKHKETVLSGKDVFELYDTYGFPPELTEEILKAEGLTYNHTEFKDNMEEQKVRARTALDRSDSGWKADGEAPDFEEYTCDFLGYEKDRSFSEITGIFKENIPVDDVSAGDHCVILLKETPFYGEGGGQVGDEGVIIGKTGKAKVLDTKKTKHGVVLHMCEMEEGVFALEDEVESIIDSKRRMDIKRNHSATHLLHAALREVLGSHVHQAGSLVAPDRLRFDFSHYTAMKPEEILEVEKLVNEKILESIPVITEVKPLKEAKDEGVIGLFEGKYGDEVRVLKMSKFSMELCGGTHVANTAEIGLFKITMETGVAAGVRRVEALTGHGAYQWLLNQEKTLQDVTDALRTTEDNVVKRTFDVLDELRDAKKEVQKLKADLAGDKAKGMEDAIQEHDGYQLIAKTFEGVQPNELKNMADELRNKHENLLVIFASVNGDTINLLTAATKALVAKGVNAGKVIKPIAQALGGNGGGKPDMAMAGAKDKDKLKEVFDHITNYL
ncbi:MAG: alanine--tRNA ligase [Tissierellia bacterium]|nr:alanine--tRNA ligase [Tissierellia bacterium]